ncbi:MAG: BON domain-containing protein [Thiogranum sp.]
MRISRLALSTLFLSSLLLSGCVPVVLIGGAATTATVVHDRRTAGSIVEDQAIELRVKTALRKDEEISDQTHINVTSYNGIVLLSGEAPGQALRTRAGEIARGSEQVRRAHNEIQIAAPSSSMTRSSDTWITTKTKSSLVGLDVKGFDPTRVKVVTENGTVFLMGMVYHREADAIVARTQQVSGVQRIVKLFEYLD